MHYHLISVVYSKNKSFMERTLSSKNIFSLFWTNYLKANPSFHFWEHDQTGYSLRYCTLCVCVLFFTLLHIVCTSKFGQLLIEGFVDGIHCLSLDAKIFLMKFWSIIALGNPGLRLHTDTHSTFISINIKSFRKRTQHKPSLLVGALCARWMS